MDGAQIPQAAQPNYANANYDNNQHADVASASFANLIQQSPALQSKVASSIATWKAELANQNAQANFAQAARPALLGNPLNVPPKLQAIRNTFFDATMISTNNDQNNGLVADQNALRANQNKANAIYGTMQALAKALYDFREDQNEWATLASLQHVFYLLEADVQFNPGAGNIQVPNIQPNNQNQIRALKQRISDDIDELIASLHEWNPAEKVSFDNRAAARQALNLNNVQDTNDSVKKFLDYKAEICGDLDEYITLDQFYQFNATAAHLADLNGLDPKQFVNPNIMNTKVFANNALYIQGPQIVRVTAKKNIERMLREKDLLTNISTKLSTHSIDRVVEGIGSELTLRAHLKAEQQAIADSRGIVLNGGNTIAENFETELDTLKKSIANKLATETGSSVKMAMNFLDKDNGLNNNHSNFDDIKELNIPNYANIHNLAELTDAILNLFHAHNPNKTIQHLHDNDLKAIKLTDTTFYKSTQPNAQANNQIPDPVAASYLEGIDTYLTEVLNIQFDHDKIFIPATDNNQNPNDITDYKQYIDALAQNIPEEITNFTSDFLKNTYINSQTFLAKIRNGSAKFIYDLLIKRKINDQENIDVLEFDQIIDRLSPNNIDQNKNDVANILHIGQQTADEIVADQNLMNQLMALDQQFAEKVKANYIKRDPQTILNDPQLRQRLVSKDTLDNLQQQLNTINTQKQNLTTTINNLNNQITQLKTAIRQKENELNSQIREKDSQIHQINEHLVNNNNNIPTTKRTTVINNIDAARMNLPSRSVAQLSNYKNYVIQFEKTTGKRVETATESELEANMPGKIKVFAGKNPLRDVLVYLKNYNK